jgi:hypothetical protein
VEDRLSKLTRILLNREFSLGGKGLQEGMAAVQSQDCVSGVNLQEN